MNIKENLILLKGEDRTETIKFCKYNSNTGKYRINFKNNTNSYDYSYNNIIWHRKPEKVDLQNVRLCVDGRQIYNVELVLKFDQYYRIFYKNRNSKVYPQSKIQILKSCLENKKSNDILQYFKELAMYISLITEDGKSLMVKKYEKLTFVEENTALATYLNPETNPIRKNDCSNFIFPFGCNVSQKEAVKNALNYSMSVIEGPPGTGKTQTILNIIANIIMQDKKVAIVSNNNAATLNVLEKLNKYNLGFIAAYLGNRENKNRFIENGQTEIKGIITDQAQNFSKLQREIDDLHVNIEKMLRLKNDLALKRQQMDELILEKNHYINYFEETYSEKNQIHLKKKVSSKQLLKLWINYEKITEKNKEKNKISIFQRAIASFVFGIGNYHFFKQPIEKIIPGIQKMFYDKKLDELQAEYERDQQRLIAFDFNNKLNELTEKSLNILKIKLGEKYKNKKRPKFNHDDLWKNSDKVLSEYPVILSTTHSVKSSLNNDIVYDYVIVDEASQVDLLTGVLAMSCAKNIVIVGDQMQLPNVVSSDDRKIAETIGNKHRIVDVYRYENHSLLSSILSRIQDVPKVLLKEHYRCHPKIIQFCNQKFYKNQLIIMTEDQGEKDVLKVYKTISGNHARGHYNQRQIDEIKMRVMPEIRNELEHCEVGIIAPYRSQKSKLQEIFSANTIDIDTVHKFQGREKDNIIITTVDNKITEFVDNPNLLNVAISRAKNKIRLVVSDNEANENTNIGDFIRYIEYNNFEVVEGDIYSVFDLLYKEYNQIRRKILKNSKRVSDYDSENLMYLLLEKILNDDAFKHLDVTVHQPLNMIIKNPDKLTRRQVKYAMNMATHIDFLIYRKVDKSPLLAIEVDGYKYHKEGTKQYARDRMKDMILSKYNIPYLRLNTTGSGEKEIVTAKLKELCG